jgi:hypothetical protein
MRKQRIEESIKEKDKSENLSIEATFQIACPGLSGKL